jgi:transcriptional regulator with XRE-family HTH domain
MQDVPSQLRFFMERERLTQASLARAAGVSQPTISRALRGVCTRHSRARAKLFNYAGISWKNDRLNVVRAAERLVAAFDRLREHSDVHADTIVRIIDALADLAKPAGGDRKRR